MFQHWDSAAQLWEPMSNHDRSKLILFLMSRCCKSFQVAILKKSNGLAQPWQPWRSCQTCVMMPLRPCSVGLSQPRQHAQMAPSAKSSAEHCLANEHIDSSRLSAAAGELPDPHNRGPVRRATAISLTPLRSPTKLKCTFESPFQSSVPIVRATPAEHHQSLQSWCNCEATSRGADVCVLASSPGAFSLVLACLTCRIAPVLLALHPPATSSQNGFSESYPNSKENNIAAE